MVLHYFNPFWLFTNVTMLEVRLALPLRRLKKCDFELNCKICIVWKYILKKLWYKNVKKFCIFKSQIKKYVFKSQTTIIKVKLYIYLILKCIFKYHIYADCLSTISQRKHLIVTFFVRLRFWSNCTPKYSQIK